MCTLKKTIRLQLCATYQEILNYTKFLKNLNCFTPDEVFNLKDEQFGDGCSVWYHLRQLEESPSKKVLRFKTVA